MPRVLIVDDEQVICQGLRAILVRQFPEALDVELAFGGGAALERLQTRAADILLLDLMMPDLDGLALLRRLSEQTELLNWMQVIIISGSSEFALAQQAMRYGVQEYLLKPVSAKDLREAVLRAVDRLSKNPPPPEKTRPDSESNEVIRRVQHYIEIHYAEALTLNAIAKVACMAPTYFSVFFKQKTGERLFGYINHVRVERAERMIRETPAAKLSEIARACGFEDEKYFSRVFRKVRGVSYQEYRSRRMAEGERD